VIVQVFTRSQFTALPSPRPPIAGALDDAPDGGSTSRFAAPEGKAAYDPRALPQAAAADEIGDQDRGELGGLAMRPSGFGRLAQMPGLVCPNTAISRFPPLTGRS
jgi:hypothetical protein